MIEYKDGRPVHFPANPDKFEFDEEVSCIFDDMARRSIPGYAETHRLHAAIVADYVLLKNRKCYIADVGASTGRFIKEVCERLQKHYKVDPEDWVHFYAFDTSPAMLARIRADYSQSLVTTLSIPAQDIYELGMVYDVVNVSYVFQFIPPSEQYKTLYELSEVLNCGGLFAVSHKERTVGSLDGVLKDLYMEFRRSNGYTPEEIRAKTEALKNSMWPMSDYDLRQMLSCCNIGSVTPTFRWLQFTSYIGIRNTDD